MKKEEYDKIIKEMHKEIDEIRNTKGQVYAGEEDQFANFKRLASVLKTDKEMIWSVYFIKHFDAIMNYTIGHYKDSEPIEGRIIDAINYLQLLYGMVREDKEYVR